MQRLQSRVLVKRIYKKPRARRKTKICQHSFLETRLKYTKRREIYNLSKTFKASLRGFFVFGSLNSDLLLNQRKNLAWR